MHHELPMLQRPETQLFEQHSPSLAHSLPDVRHSGFSGAHTSLTQRLPQQSASASQLPASETQASLAHVPPLQRRLQQSVGTEQRSPGSPHSVIDDSHLLVSGLQTREQQSSSRMQSSEYTLQAAPPLPPMFEPPMLEPPMLEPPMPEPLVPEPPAPESAPFPPSFPAPAELPPTPGSPASPPVDVVPLLPPRALEPPLALLPPELEPPSPAGPPSSAPGSSPLSKRVELLEPHAAATPAAARIAAKTTFKRIGPPRRREETPLALGFEWTAAAALYEGPSRAGFPAGRSRLASE
jgi:hypothetical protein